MLRHATSVAGKRLEGHRVQEDNRLPDSPAVQGANAPFTLVVYGDYEFVEADSRGARGSGVQPEHLAHPDGEWLPMWHDVIHKAGCNGAREVKRDGKAVVDMTQTYAGIVSKGGEVIRPTDRRLDPEFRDYVMRWGVKGATTAFHAFATTEPRLFGRDVQPVPDHGWICRFRRSLVGPFVPPMDRQHLLMHLRLIDNRVKDRHDALTRGKMSQGAFERYEAEQEALRERMEAAWERQFGDTARDMGRAVKGETVTDPTPEEPTPRKTRSRK